MIDDPADYPSQFLADVYEKLNGESVSVENHDAITEYEVLDVELNGDVEITEVVYVDIEFVGATPERNEHSSRFIKKDFEKEVENRNDITL